MGSYCSLSLAGYEIDSSKSYINPFWSCLFKEGDKRSKQVKYDAYYTEPLGDDDQVPTSEYAATAKTMKLRLEILGYTLEGAKKIFTAGMENVMTERIEFYRKYDSTNGETHIKHLKTLADAGFDGWVLLLKHIFDSKMSRWDIKQDRDLSTDDLYNFMMRFDDAFEDIYLGYPSSDQGFFIRAALEAVANDAELVLDITSLVYAGYYEEDETVCQTTSQAYINSNLKFQKVIILTEGTSDSSILSRSLKLLYPKIADYFSFLDFDSIKPDGGSSALERMVKSFAAAGINNKIIAIFDNDAAGMVAFKRLKAKALPENISVITLPNLSLAKQYPTIGPQGNTVEDINGRACSIEMYLGTDVLTHSGQLIPVHWRNLEEQINQYQGEVAKKAQVQQDFLKKLSSAEKSGSTNNGDWLGLELIFSTIFKEASTI
jgi:hypothetical protein